MTDYRLDEFRTIVDSINDSFSKHVNANKKERNYQCIVTSTLFYSIKRVRSVITLCSASDADSAMVLARTLAEFAICLYWISQQKDDKFKEIVRNFHRSLIVDRLKQEHNIDELLGCAENESLYQNHLDYIQEHWCLPKELGNYWWTGNGNKSFKSIIDDTKKDGNNRVIEIIHSLYKKACTPIHFSASTLFSKSSEISDILMISATSFYMIVIIACKELSVSVTKNCNELHELVDYYHKQFSIPTKG